MFAHIIVVLNLNGFGGSMKKSIFSMMILTLLFFVGCSEKKSEGTKEQKKKSLNVGLVMATGGRGDKSFNDSAYNGLSKAKEELGVNFKYVEPATPAEDEQFLREYADADFDLVIAIGFQMRDAAEKVAKDYPNIKFVVVDSVIDTPNAKNILFKEKEGSFLVGALAGMMTKTNVLGFTGGVNAPIIQRFQQGFEEGAKYINPEIKVLSVYTPGSNPFNDPVRGKEGALTQISQGADVLYHAAGGTGLGVIEAAKEKGVYAIGVDSDQDDVAPGVVLTSMNKNVDIALYDAVKELKDGNFTPGIYEMGVAENGVGITELKYTADIIGKENLNRLEEIKNKIVSGEIKVD